MVRGMGYILSLDAGTTSSRALIVNKEGEVVALSQKPFRQIYPHPGWVEHDPKEMIETQLLVIQEALEQGNIPPQEIAAIGIANQRETTILWDKKTGETLGNAIVWSDRRTKEFCDAFSEETQKEVHAKTGLYIEPYFSASKIAYILDHFPGARERAERGDLCFGTVNTFILWHLTDKRIFATDVSNASRTLLFNLHTQSWDRDLLSLFNIPEKILPQIVTNSEIYGETRVHPLTHGVPITSMVGDQQASLFAQNCFREGDLQCTYGTGSFIMMNIGETPALSQHKLLTTVAWKIPPYNMQYAIEGLVYAAGSVVEWLKDGLGIIKSPKEMADLAASVHESGGLSFVPTFNGLASPYWNAHARGVLLGITASTTIGHIARAALEGIAHQVSDVIEAMKQDSKLTLKTMKVGGGMSDNLFLMQVQADLLQTPVARSSQKEMTALGAAYMAGLAIGYWTSIEEISYYWKVDRTFEPLLKKQEVEERKKIWQRAIEITELWANGGKKDETRNLS